MAGETASAGRWVHLVGSVPLRSAEEVFRTASAALGLRLRRLPDGETGKRLRWNSWTAPLYARTEGLVLVPAPEGNYTPWRQARLVVDPDELSFPRIGYASAARASYEVFSALKREGAIPEHVRFQVCIPSPIAPMIVLVEEGSRAAVEPAFVERLLTEIGEILDAIPHEELAIQWDVCQDVGIWEGYYPAYFDDPEAGVLERLARVSVSIPERVELGFHLCYGDFGHRHFMQPRDAAVLRAIANGLARTVDRRIDWIHMPVPRDRDDAAYFAPLGELTLAPETELYLGLVHLTDGLEGARRRMRAAASVLPRFGIGTECGFGRRPPETVARLLRLHAEAAALAL
jgi:hypothetical protein